MDFNYVFIVWMVVGVILVIAEVFTAGFYIGLIGLAAIGAGLTSLVTDSIVIQLFVFTVLLILFIVLLRPVVKRFFSKEKESKSNINALIDEVVIVEEDIDNDYNKGYVKKAGDFWKAKSVDGKKIAKGTPVVIKKIEGNTCYVDLKEEK